MGELVHLMGTVERIIYQNRENGFAVFSLKVSASETVTMSGILPDIFQGELAHVKGLWGFHQKYGRQFEVKEYSSEKPSDVIGIEKYLASGLIKGIGPKMAKRLVDRFGVDTLRIIDETPDALAQVEGIGPHRVSKIAQAWADQREIAKVMVFLRAKDVATAHAVKIFKTYGSQALEKIQQNPYQLVYDIWGIGFKTADTIALKIGLDRDSLERVKAGILYAINEVTEDGHLYAEIGALKEKVIQLLELEAEQTAQVLKQALHSLYQERKIVLITTSDDQHYVTLPQFYYSEKGIAYKVLKMLQSSSPLKLDAGLVYQKLLVPDQRGQMLNDDQQRGIMMSIQHRLTIVTGGPGTGKTTLVKRLLQVLDDHTIRVRLAAPTGRAAKRIFESTGRTGETLHRLLEFDPSGFGFKRNELNAIDTDFLVVDEASMIDVFLMHSLLKAIPDRAHLLLLGDIDQLPSVGAGNILNDLIASEKVPVVRLTEIFRQAQDSMIIVNAHRVNKGEFPRQPEPGSKRDFMYYKQQEPEEVFPLLGTLYRGGLQKLGIDPENSVVLTPMNRGLVGTQRLNQELQNILNAGGEEASQIIRFGVTYKVRDRVMQIKNNYDKFVFNGDFGTIQKIDREDQKMIILFGNREHEYDFSELNEITLAYAISIHKSQGSEFDAVIIPIFMQHFMLLQRNLLYTAITRAKKLCVLLGQTKAVAVAINNNKGVVRTTFLKAFMTSDLEAR